MVNAVVLRTVYAGEGQKAAGASDFRKFPSTGRFFPWIVLFFPEYYDILY